MKQFFFYPLVLAMLVISGCSNDAPVEVRDVNGLPSENRLDPIQPLEPVRSLETTRGWQPNVPSSPEVINPDTQYPVVVPNNPPQRSVPEKDTDQNFSIPRDLNTNAPIYSQIEKGFYQGNSYTVRKGDSLFLIAYIAGKDVNEIAALNNLSEPYALSTGQVIKLRANEISDSVNSTPTNNHVATTSPSNATYTVKAGDTLYSIARGAGQSVTTVAALNNISQPYTLKVGQVLRLHNSSISTPTTDVVKLDQSAVTTPSVTYTSAPNNTQIGSDGTITGPVKAVSGNPTELKSPKPEQSPVVSQKINWRWPTSGRILERFSNSDGGNKGLIIGGTRGQAINATAAGRVVYAGNALRGYGNLIIIKHNDDFLSAYAHNETMLVKDQQEVKAGQQIAKMGSSGTNGVKLHFEIRYKGKPVDPLRYLPAK